MKKVIFGSNSELPNDWKPNSLILHKGNEKYRFRGHASDSRGVIIGDYTKIAPYDDAEYVWARIEGNGQVKFIRDGKVIDKMQTHAYLDFEEDYEQVWEYFDQINNDILDLLVDYNKDIKPRMIYD